MNTVSIGGRYWLDAPAAAAYEAMCRDGCPAGITEAGRTRAYQTMLYLRWKAGLLKAPSVAKPGTSLHEKGRALDLPGDAANVRTPRGWVTAHGAKYGFVAGRVPGEPWHFEFVGATHVPAPNVPPVEIATEEDDLMYTLVSFKDSPEIGLFNPRTNTYQGFKTMVGVAYARDALQVKEATFASMAEFDSWRNTLASVLEG